MTNEQSGHEPPRRFMFHSVDLGIAAGIVGALVVGLAFAFIAPSASTASARMEAIRILAVLDRSPGIEDTLSAGFPLSAHGIGELESSSVRHAGREGQTSFWIALDQRSNVCLVAQSVDQPELTASSCTSPGELASRALPLRFDSKEWTFEAYLIPDGVDRGPLAYPWVTVGDNLLSYPIDPFEHAPEKAAMVELDRNGAKFMIERVGAPDAGR